MTWQRRNHYELLEIGRSVSAAELKDAYLLQSLAWAPDKMPAKFKDAATARMQAINAAHAVLNAPTERKKYDASLPPEDVEEDFFPEPLQNLPQVWKRMASWMKDQDVGVGFNRKMVFQAGDCIERRRAPSEKQRRFMLESWDLAIAEGFDPEATDA